LGLISVVVTVVAGVCQRCSRQAGACNSTTTLSLLVTFGHPPTHPQVFEFSRGPSGALLAATTTTTRRCRWRGRRRRWRRPRRQGDHRRRVGAKAGSVQRLLSPALVVFVVFVFVVIIVVVVVVVDRQLAGVR
jgi:hypothetical protein